jgi:hypothetical protein
MAQLSQFNLGGAFFSLFVCFALASEHVGIFLPSGEVPRRAEVGDTIPRCLGCTQAAGLGYLFDR